MSTVLIVVIAVIVVAIVVVLIRRARTKSELREVQTDAQHDDVAHHRARAAESRSEAELAEERAKRAAAEAELNERQAEEREKDLDAS